MFSERSVKYLLWQQKLEMWMYQKSDSVDLSISGSSYVIKVVLKRIKMWFCKSTKSGGVKVVLSVSKSGSVIVNVLKSGT